jgi:hypothetical protein
VVAGDRDLRVGGSAAITLALRVMMPIASRKESPPLRLRVSAVAVWFAPATILFVQFSPVGMAAGLALAISAARLLSAPWRNPFPELRNGFLGSRALSTIIAIYYFQPRMIPKSYRIIYRRNSSIDGASPSPT